MDPEIAIMYLVNNGIPVTRNNLKVKLSENFNRKLLPSPHESSIEKVWAERTAGNPHMWNGTKFRLESVQQKGDTVTFNLGITCYRDFIGTNWSPTAKLFHALGKENHNNTQAYLSDALGVGALVETTDGFAILLRRSKHCGEAQGLWDIPGGHPEPQEIVGKVHMEDIDLSKMSANAVIQEIFNSTKQEVIDEVNIPGETLSDPVLLGVARNTTSAGRPSSEYYIKCSMTSNEVKNKYLEGTHSEAEESTNITFIPIADILRLQEMRDIWNEMAPSAKGCITLYQLWKGDH